MNGTLTGIFLLVFLISLYFWDTTQNKGYKISSEKTQKSNSKKYRI